jgi:presenilin-like A22 family membrane protease
LFKFVRTLSKNKEEREVELQITVIALSVIQLAYITILKFVSNLHSWLNVINVQSNVGFNTLTLKHAEYTVSDALCYVNQSIVKVN